MKKVRVKAVAPNGETAIFESRTEACERMRLSPTDVSICLHCKMNGNELCKTCNIRLRNRRILLTIAD